MFGTLHSTRPQSMQSRSRRPRPIASAMAEPLEERRLMSVAVATLATFQGIQPPTYIAVDKNGNVYAEANDGILEIAAGTHKQRYIPNVVANGEFEIDVTGSLYGEAVGNGALDQAFEFSTVTHVATLFPPSLSLYLFTADSAGDLYGFTTDANGTTAVVEVAAGTNVLSTLTSLNGADTSYNFLCRDMAGDLFWHYSGASSSPANQIIELAAGTHTVTTVASLDGQFQEVQSLVADSAGDLYATDGTRLVEVAAGTHTVATISTPGLPGGAGGICGLLLDAQDNLFVLASYDPTFIGYDKQAIFRIAAETHAVTAPVTFDLATDSTAAGFGADAAGNLYESLVQSDAASATGSYVVQIRGTGFVPEASAPVVFTQPADEAGVPDGSASFTAASNPDPAPTVQWQSSADGGKTFTNITGSPSATATTLTLTDLAASQSGMEYRAVFTNSLGTATSDPATLSVVPIEIVEPGHAGPSVVSGTTTTLSVLADSEEGEADLTYRWAVVRSPSGGARPSFSANGDNAARHSVVTFHKAGRYSFDCTISDGNGHQIVTSVSVDVVQTATSLRPTPHDRSIALGQPVTYRAAVYDQFGKPMRSLLAIQYSIASGPGTIGSSSGIFTASLPGAAMIEAEEDDLSATVGALVIA